MIGRIPVLDIRPLVDCGRRPAKAVVGETFQVTATVFREGHDAVAANVVLRDPTGRSGPWTPMYKLTPGTDRWGAEVAPTTEGRWTYTVEAWGDPVATWRQHADIKIPAGIDTDLVLAEGAELYERAATGVSKEDGRAAVLAAVDALCDRTRPPSARHAAALAPEVVEVLDRHPALQQLRNLTFHHADDDDVLVYSKRTGDDVVLVVVNLDPHHTHEATVSLNMPGIGLAWHDSIPVRDELTGDTYHWGRANYVRLEPGRTPAHIFTLRPSSPIGGSPT